MISPVSSAQSRFLALAFVALLPAAAVSQAVPAVKGAPSVDPPPKWNLFLGYSFLSPHGTVYSSTDPNSALPASYHHVSLGGDVSGSYFFGRHLGMQAEVGFHEWGVENSTPTAINGTEGNNDGFTTVSGGLVLRDPRGAFTPFVHALGGGTVVDGPAHNPSTWGPDVTLGGGLDYNTPLFNHHLALRLIQADYEYMHISYPTGNGGTVGINTARLSAGIVFPASGERPTPVFLVCTANPAVVYPGDPLAITADAGNLDPKLNVVYSWSGTGVTGNGTTATVATAALAPGSYTVNCGVKEGKSGKEGLKPWQTSNASASFTVKPLEPPTISCSANPSTIKPGETSTVTSRGVSPQNRPLTYSYSATAGSIKGSGAREVFFSTGAPTGTVKINCNVSDDKGQTATANTSVTITAPYVAPVPHTQPLCSITFSKDKARPTRVDNEAKACLDEVALTLQKQPDAKAVVVGEATAKEKAKIAKDEEAAKKHKHLNAADLAAERAVNTKDYLVTEKGIDGSRVSVATGTADEQSVEDYLVPSGATFAADVTGTTLVNEDAVKAQPRQALAVKHAHKKAAGK
jgi:outer membrane protein OmpA-like peptidoglycan-associated protein